MNDFLGLAAFRSRTQFCGWKTRAPRGLSAGVIATPREVAIGLRPVRSV